MPPISIAQDRGRPLHVFDADKLSGNLHARMAKEHEQVLALDGKTYVLDSDTIVIADDSFARGIAGIMGGDGYRLFAGNHECLYRIRLVRSRPHRARRAASRASFPTRAIALSAASIRNSCCRGWSCAPS